MKNSVWGDWSDEEIVEEIRKLRKHGFGTLTVEVFEHKVRELTPAPQLRKLAARVDERLIRI